MNESVNDENRRKTVKLPVNNLYFGAPEPSILEEVAGLARMRTGSVILLVPDQFKLEKEQELGQLLGGALLHVRVMSFRKLAEKIVEEDFIPISAMGKRLFLSGILERHKQRLSVFRRHSSKTEFIERLAEILTEMEAPLSLDDSLMGTDLYRKVQDLNLLYEDFQLLFQKYTGDERLIGYAAGCCETSDFIRTSRFYISNYYSMSDNEILLYRSLCRYSLGVSMTLNFVEEDSPSVFDFTRRIFGKMESGISAFFVDSSLHPALSSSGTTSSSSNSSPSRQSQTSHFFTDFSKAIFAQDSEAIADLFGDFVRLGDDGRVVYQDCPVEVYEAERPFDEAVFVTEKIRSLLEAGVRPSDITILCPNFEVYSGLSERLLSRAGIPYFIDGNRTFASHPLAEFVDGLLQYQMDRSPEAIMTMLRSGLLPISEVYALRLQLQLMERRLHDPFLYDLLEKLDLRKRLGGRFSVRAFVTELYDVLSRETGVEDFGTISVLEQCRLHSKVLTGVSGEVTDEADYGVRIHNKFIEVLDELYELSDIMGEIDFALARRTMADAFRGMSIAGIPGYLEYVTIAPLDRVRLARSKYCFVPGAVRGELPRKKYSTAVFSMDEQNTLIELQQKKRFTGFPDSDREAFHLHLVLTTPSERLYFTYPGGSRSVVLNTLAAGFSKALHRDNISFPGMVFSEEHGTDHDFTEINTRLGSFRVLQEAGLDSVPCGEGAPDPADIDLNPSTLELYLQCPFRFFVYQSLGVREMNVDEMNHRTAGTLIHKVLETYVNEMISRHSAKNDSSPSAQRDDKFVGAEKYDGTKDCRSADGEILLWNLTERKDEIRSKVAAIVEKLPEYHNQNHAAQAVYRERFVDACTLYAQAIEFHLTSGEFFARSTEKSIAYELDFTGDFFVDFAEEFAEFCSSESDAADFFKSNPEHSRPRRIRFKGTIDRLDVAEYDGREYYRIVDYKTGKKRANIRDLLDLRDIQLAQYYYAMNLLHPGAKCAALLLLHLNDRVAVKNRNDAAAKGEELTSEDPAFAYLPLYGMGSESDIAKKLQCRCESLTALFSLHEGGGKRSDRILTDDPEIYRIQAEMLYRQIRKHRGDMDVSFLKVLCSELSSGIKDGKLQGRYGTHLHEKILLLISKMMLWIASMGISEGRFEIIPGDHCDYCPYKGICRREREADVQEDEME